MKSPSKPTDRARNAAPLLLCLTVLGPAPAGAEIFMRVDNIMGDSVDRIHGKEIDILSYTQTYRRPSTTHSGGGTGTPPVTCGDVTVLKNIDRSSPLLLKHVALGTHAPRVDISFRAPGALQDYYRIQIEEVEFISLDQTDQPDPAKIVERLQLSARRFRYSYLPQLPNGSFGAAIEFGFDCATQSQF